MAPYCMVTKDEDLETDLEENKFDGASNTIMLSAPSISMQLKNNPAFSIIRFSKNKLKEVEIHSFKFLEFRRHGHLYFEKALLEEDKNFNLTDP